jgi:hypothetical protein
MKHELGMLEFQHSTGWASASLLTPKKDKTPCFISDFREVNK